MTNPVPARIRLAEQFLTFAVMRELFPLCHYCGESLSHVPLRDLVKVQDRNRLAHLRCPQAEVTTDAA